MQGSHSNWVKYRTAAIAIALAPLLAGQGIGRNHGAIQGRRAAAVSRAVISPAILAQGDEQSGEAEVSPAEIDKYVAVYGAMHRDHALTVEQAAAQQGMSLAAFRALESRVEHDDAAMERARDELQASAVHASPGGSR